MRQHGQEFVLPLTGLLQFLGLAKELHLHSLSVGDVGDEAECPLDLACGVAKRIDADVEPQVTEGEVLGLASAETSILANGESVRLGLLAPQAQEALCPRSRSRCDREYVREFGSPARLCPSASSSMTPSLIASNVVCHCRVES